MSSRSQRNSRQNKLVGLAAKQASGKSIGLACRNLDPKVGIFWFFRGQVLGCAVRLAGRNDTGNFIDSPINHYEYWPRLQATNPALRFHDYIDIPRGRALFRKRGKRTVIYMDRALFNAPAQRRIRRFFGGNADSCMFEADEHYTTDPAALDELFGNH